MWYRTNIFNTIYFKKCSVLYPTVFFKFKKTLIIFSILNVNVTYFMSFTNSFAIKSFAFSEIVRKASSSKSYFPIVTLAIVSTSVPPIKGDKPDNLKVNHFYCGYIPTFGFIAKSSKRCVL